MNFARIPTDIRVPGFYAEIDGSRAGTFSWTTRRLLIGIALTEAVTFNQPMRVSTVEEARALFGPGSPLAHMVDIYRRNDTFGEIWCLPIADDGTKPAWTVTYTGTATEAGTLPLYIAGVRVRVTVPSGMTAAQLATAVAAAITADTSLYVTATADAGVVTLTARFGGAFGDQIDIGHAYRGRAGGDIIPAGIAAAVANTVAGSGDAEIADALASLGEESYDHVASMFTDATNLDAADESWDDVTGRWSWDRQVYGHVYSARHDSLSDLGTFGNSRNGPHQSTYGVQPRIKSAPWEIAAGAIAQLGRSIDNDPAVPARDLRITGIFAAAEGMTWTRGEANSLLFDGVSTLRVADDGSVWIEQTITHYQQNPQGQPDNAFLKVNTLATLAYVLRRLRFVVDQATFRKKLVSDGSPNYLGSNAVRPRDLTDVILAEVRVLVDRHILENYEAMAANTYAERDPDNPDRVNVLFSPDLVNQLDIIAVLAQFRLQY